MPWRSTMARILTPLPRRVGPISAPPPFALANVASMKHSLSSISPRSRSSLRYEGQNLDALAATCRTDFCTATFRARKRRVDEALALVNFATVTQFVGQLRKNLAQYLAFAPLLEAAMHCLVVRIALRKHVPLRAGVQNPQHRVQHLACWHGLAARATIGNVLFGKILPNPFPML